MYMFIDFVLFIDFCFIIYIDRYIYLGEGMRYRIVYCNLE